MTGTGRAAELIQMYCRTEHAVVWCVRGPDIVCQNGHQVAKGFPDGEFWYYCCDCNIFTPFVSLKGDERYMRCPQCDRSTARWYVCANCNIMLVQSDELERIRTVTLTSTGRPSPACPGCLKTEAKSTTEHDCYTLFVSFATQRSFCPFCKEPTTNSGEFMEKVSRQVSGKAARFGAEAELFHAFMRSSTWRDSLKSHLRLPKTRRGWTELVGIVGAGVTILGIAVAFFPEVPAAVSWSVKKNFLNRSPLVERIECEHGVSQGERLPMRVRASDPDGDQLDVQWSCSAGRIEGHGTEVHLNTEGILAPAVVTDLTVQVTVRDQFGKTASHQEVISVFSRRVSNNPPIFKIPPRCNCTNPEVRLGETISLYALAEDEDEKDTLTYEWQSSSPALEIVKTNSTPGSTIILNTSGIGQLVSPVPVKLTLRVSDNRGGQASGDLTIMLLPRQLMYTASPASNVKPNHSPKLEFFVADSVTVEQGGRVTLWVFVTDADGDAPLYYDWRASAGEIINKGDNAVFNTAGVSVGQKIITVTISDGHGASTSQKLFVTVTPAANKTASPSPVTLDQSPFSNDQEPN